MSEQEKAQNTATALPWNGAPAAVDQAESEEGLGAALAARPPESSDTGVRRFGLLVLFVVFGIFGVWAAVAPLGSSVHSAGKLEVEAYRKSVQHLTGGQVASILVKDGDRVEAGQLLIKLDDTQLKAQFEAALPFYAELLAQESRLLAEQAGRGRIEYGREFLTIEDATLREEQVRGQNALFEARRQERQGQRRILEQRSAQISRQIAGIKGIMASSRQRLAYFDEEIAEWQPLFEQQLTDKLRLRDLKKERARIEGEVASASADISRLELAINQTESEILQKELEFSREVASSLRENQAKLAEARARVTALRDGIAKTELKAPATGVVVGLDVHTLGGVVQPGKTVLEIVPANERLLVRTKFLTVDIDRVQVGLPAEVQFSSFNTQVPHSIEGEVIHVSADSFTDQRSGMPYYEAVIRITEAGLKRLEHYHFELVPGMPVEVMIKAGERTMLEYLVQPLTKMFTRTFREK